MKIILLISYLIGGTLSPIPLNNISPPINQSATDKLEQVISVIDEKAHVNILLTSVNDISLYDDVEDVIAKKGIPEQITIVPDFAEYIRYEYSHMTVNFRDNLIDYVEITNEANTLYLDQTEVPATIEGIKAVLGAPDYIAEDGIVFQRDEALLKLFINEDSGELESIAYYHIAST